MGSSAYREDCDDGGVAGDDKLMTVIIVLKYLNAVKQEYGMILFINLLKYEHDYFRQQFCSNQCFLFTN
jgi:hypothetical protein